MHLSRSASIIVLVTFLCGCAVRRQPTPAAINTAVEPTPVVRAKVSSETLQSLAKQPAAAFEGQGWTPMFDGKTLKDWRVTDFAGRGEVRCEDGLIILEMGEPFSGINWTNKLPTTNYEIALDAMRVLGSDFFCGLTFPVDASFCTLIVGGWGGSLVGLSSLDSLDASENETARYMSFDQQHWYRIRVRVTEGRIEGWIDKEKVVDVKTKDRRISLRAGDIELSKPLGIASWQATAALREIRMRRIAEPADRPKKY
jgi:hypothetical protein